MSGTSIYLWDANQFNNPSEYLPKTFEDAIRICESIIDLPKTETTNPKFVQLTDYLETVARKDQYSPDYNMNFYHATQRTIEHNQKKENNGQFLEIYRSYELLDPTEVLSVIQKKNKELKLVILDSLGMLILPNGDTYPEELKTHLKRYPVKLQKPTKEGLPKRRADFIKQYKPTIDTSLAKLGYVENFDIHPHEMQPDKVSDTLYYVKQTKHGFNIVYVDIDSGMDANGTYTLGSGLTFYLDKTVELAKEFCRLEIEGEDNSVYFANLSNIKLFQNIEIRTENELHDYLTNLTEKLNDFKDIQSYKAIRQLALKTRDLSQKDIDKYICFNRLDMLFISKIINLLLLLKLTDNPDYAEVKILVQTYAEKHDYDNFSEWDSKQNFKDIYPKLTQAIDSIEPESEVV